ncbi:ADOP family duplicated permease [Candidatus Zixiibacteriota bacterium]
MAVMRSLQERFRALFHRKTVEQEMEEEFRFHLEQAIERNIGRGMSPEEAHRIAHAEFGGVERRKEQIRDEQGIRFLINFSQNLRYAWRILRKSPGFSLLAVIIIALGVGATTAIFSIVNSLLFAPLYGDGSPQVLRIFSNDPEDGRPRWNSYPDFLSLSEGTDLFTSMGATSDIFPFSLVTDQCAETVLCDIFSAGLFSVLDIQPYLGRTFLPDEDVPGVSGSVVMVSYSVWKDRHGSDPDIVGKTLKLNGYPVTVVGVGPPGFKGVYVGVLTEYWVSWGTASLINAAYAYMEDRSNRECNIFARMKPGISIEQARSALGVVATGLAEQYPDTNEGMSLTVLPSSEVRMDPLMDKALLPLSGFLMVIVILVLLVACSNLAGFLLMRAISRRKEITVRIALGVGRKRLIAQLLTENALLGLIGGVLGIVVAFGLAGVIASYRIPLPFALGVDLNIDGTVLIFAMILSVTTGLLIGLVPALQSSKPDIVAALKDAPGTSTVSHQSFRLRNTFIIAQVTVSIVLLIGAVLFLRSLDYRNNIDFGFESEHQAIAAIDVALGGYTDEVSARVFLEQYRERILSHPEVGSVALASRIPFGLFGAGTRTDVRLPEITVVEGEEEEDPAVQYAAVSPDFFDAMGIRITRGETFPLLASGSSPTVVMVNEALAERLWGSAPAVGQTLLIGGEGEERSVEVIGVVNNSTFVSLRRPDEPFIYLPFTGRYTMTTVMIARTSGNPDVLPELFRRELESLDSSVPVFDARTMDEHLDIVTFVDRTAALLLSVFGVLAMIMASIGLYGTIAFSVSLRTREVGIRMAMGAGKSQVIMMVLKQGIRLILIGVVIGCVIAGLVSRLLSKLLLGISTLDPVSFIGVALLFFIITVLASYFPALRAAKLDPMKTLRYE